MVMNDDARRELQAVQAHLYRLGEQTKRIEAHRDRLVLQLADNVGAHDRRPVAVRQSGRETPPRKPAGRLAI